MFRMIRGTVDKLKAMKVSPKMYTRSLLRYIGTDLRDDFKFGFVTHSEAYNFAVAILQEKNVTLPLVRLSPDPADPSWARAVLARDKTIRCVLATYLHIDLAIDAARQFNRHFLSARPEHSIQSFVELPPGGRRRYILARDSDTAADLSALLSKIVSAADLSRFTIASLKEEKALVEMEKYADEIFVTALARPYAISRFGSAKRMLPLPNNISDDTIQEMMFHYVFA